MAKEMVFKKNVFGGFNRDDVVLYINELLNELKLSNEENQRKDARITELENKLHEYETAAANTDLSLPADLDTDDPQQVLSHVDKILQCYLSKDGV